MCMKSTCKASLKRTATERGARDDREWRAACVDPPERALISPLTSATVPQSSKLRRSRSPAVAHTCR
ncbi:unnamed protein product [Parnassius mnemosyne]|uniref:Uncharacterized protein n=1 Tax=Parnassius mnemosyne TaxID=213953 RepID=A0AAV1M313_9NEOP